MHALQGDQRAKVRAENTTTGMENQKLEPQKCEGHLHSRDAVCTEL